MIKNLTAEIQKINHLTATEVGNQKFTRQKECSDTFKCYKSKKWPCFTATAANVLVCRTAELTGTSSYSWSSSSSTFWNGSCGPTQRQNKSVSKSSRTLLVDTALSAFLVFLLWDPHLLERALHNSDQITDISFYYKDHKWVKEFVGDTAEDSAGMHMPWVTLLQRPAHSGWLQGVVTGIGLQRPVYSLSVALAVVQPAECEWWPECAAPSSTIKYSRYMTC